MSMSGHESVDPLWACVKVDDCCDPSSVGTLTHVKLLKNVCSARFYHRLRVAYISGLLFLFCDDE
jgi:hypothetical protein